jgi:hypothetical protein
VYNQTLSNSSASVNSSRREFSIANDGSSYKSDQHKKWGPVLAPPLPKKNYIEWKNKKRR